MHEVLRRHVVDNVWCAPLQDKHAIYKPRKITPKNGVFNHVRTVRDLYTLPTDHQYHVFQIGQVPPSLLGIHETRPSGRWYTLSELMNENDLVINAYTVNGFQFPRFEVYLRLTGNRNVLVAVRRYQGELDLNVVDLYLRFYSNSYFGSDAFIGDTAIYTEGRWINTTADLVAFQSKHSQYKARGDGHISVTVSGRLIKVPSNKSIELGEWAEFVYDASVAKVIRLPANELLTYDSVLDGIRKYLLHVPNDIGMGIVYKDDIDIQLFRFYTNALQRGVYCHQNRKNTLRMITHQDYGISVADLEQYALNVDFWENPEQMMVEIHLRHGGSPRPLVYEQNRIHELYKLSDAQIVPAMLGNLSAIDEWRVEHLEQSKYPELMRNRDYYFDESTIREALGYNAISRLLNLNPVQVVTRNNRQVATRPPQCEQSCLALEYDSEGQLVQGDYLTNPDNEYYVQNAETTLVEFYPGPAGVNAQRYFDEDSVVVGEDTSVRLYKCAMLQGQPTYEWVPAEPDDYMVTDVGSDQKEYAWQVDGNLWYRLFLLDDGVVWYEQTVSGVQHSVILTLGCGQRYAGVWSWGTAEIPFDFLQICMNGASLVEGIDYTVDWPKVVIHTAKGLDVTTPNQKISVLMMGLPDDVLEYTPRKDTGYTVHGQISRDHEYQVRDDRVNRVIVDGKLLSLEDMEYAEGMVSKGTLPSGRPYSVRRPPIPIATGTFDVDRKAWLDEARELDDRLGAWMTQAKPEDPISGPNLINGKYVLISPTLSAILRDFERGILDDSDIPDNPTDVWLYEYLKDYLWLKDFDPAMNPVHDCAIIYPHGYNGAPTLPKAQYKVLVRANHLLFNNRVHMHELIRIGA